MKIDRKLEGMNRQIDPDKLNKDRQVNRYMQRDNNISKSMDIGHSYQ